MYSFFLFVQNIYNHSSQSSFNEWKYHTQRSCMSMLKRLKEKIKERIKRAIRSKKTAKI